MENSKQEPLDKDDFDEEERKLNFVMRRVLENVAEKARLRDERFRKDLHERLRRVAEELKK